MEGILLLLISCLALHHGEGAPTKAVYKFVKCNPKGDQSNCVTHQSKEMAWSSDLPAKLPPSSAQLLESEPVEEEDKTPMSSQEEEPPAIFLSDEGSGRYEGSATEGLDSFYVPFEVDTGSGEYWAEDYAEQKQDLSGPDEFLVGESKPAEEELREDHLLSS